MFEQEGVRSAQKDYALTNDGEAIEQTHTPVQKSTSYEVISRLSKKIIDYPDLSHSLPIVSRTKQKPPKELLESTLDPNILRQKLEQPPVESVNWSEGQTLNLFKWISRKKKEVKPSEPDEEGRLVDRSSSDSSFSEVSIDPDLEKSDPAIPIKLFDHMQLLLEMMDQVSPILDKSKQSDWIHYLKVFCSENPHLGESLVGKVIYVLDSLPEDFCSKLSEENPKNLISWVKETYSLRMNLIKKQVARLCRLHEATGPQSSNLVHQTKLPFAIAQTLITSNGQVNYALCRSLMRHLLPPEDSRLPFHQDIHRVLQLIHDSATIRGLLSEIDIPSCQYSLANQLIKVQMGVDYSSQIYKRDAIVTALTACLSHLRQGPTGSCFATHFAIVLLSSHVEQCIKDFQMLLSESKLTRVVDGVQKDFPFLLMMSSPSSGEELSVTSEGQVVKSDGHSYNAWESPGIQAACRSIKIDTPQETIREVIQNYFEEKEHREEMLKMSIQTILSLLCDHQIKVYNLLPSKKMKLYSLAHFAYASQAKNGLLSVWENSIAEMAEGKEGGMIMPPLLNAIQKPILQLICNELLVSSLPQNIQDSITLELSHELQKRIHLHYDPDIFNDSIDSKHMSSEGGYIIYDTLHEIFPNLWKRIDTPEQYCSFIANVFCDVVPKISKLLQTHYPMQYHDDIIKNITEKIGTTEFTYQSMITYYPAYQSQKDLLANWNKCKYTPWRTLSGNLADKVREVYMEDDGEVEKSILKPTNGYDLLLNLLSEIKKMPIEIREIYRDNPNKKIPVFTPTHAFSLLLGHNSLQRYADTNLSCSKWIKDNLYNPCHEAIYQKVDRETRELIIAFASEQIPHLSKREEFLEAASLLSNDLSYPKFRTCLIKLLDIIDSQHPKREERAYLIDNELCSRLPHEISQVVADHAIHFADTNWSENLQDIHLCVTLSPCTGKLAIMQIQDNGRNLKPVKQYWLVNQNWEFISNPEQALPKNDT